MEQTAFNSNNSQKFFLYARKSTDVEDKQMRSIPDQLLELREYAKREGLYIVEELTEAKTAKAPGRVVFNSMLSRIENGEAEGIVAWHPDRLARNSIDGGKIIYLLDLGKLKNLKFPQHWFENTPQGKFSLNMAFCQSKYFVDSLSENTKRGIRQKVKRGEMPGLAPVGYLNIMTNNRKIIVIDKKRALIIRQAFEMFATAKYRIQDICNFLAENGMAKASGKLWKSDRVSKQILSNPFYYGHFKYMGEIHEGVHQPIITKKLWDAVQIVWRKRSHSWKEMRPQKPLTGLFRCGECGMMITAELQKGYIYYRCTKKSKVRSCSQLYIREEELDRQLSDQIATVSLRQDWADKMLAKLSIEEKNVAQSCDMFVGEKQAEIKSINEKLQRLLDSYLEQDIEREDYLVKKADLLALKKKLEEQILSFQQTKNAWLEPMKQWIVEAAAAANIARSKDLNAKKVLAQKIFGSNPTLKDRKVYCNALNIWSALRADPPTRDSEPTAGIEPATPFLPRTCSTTEPCRQK
ncbi:MAG: recombinase [Microgenomates group bacterium Gr01-1014_7]|nr:MAG: recombinase [Microgenomates group bacterium Gr01-1014_7]